MSVNRDGEFGRTESIGCCVVACVLIVAIAAYEITKLVYPPQQPAATQKGQP